MSYKLKQNRKNEEVINEYWENYHSEASEIKEGQSSDLYRDNLNKIKYQNWFSRSLMELNNYFAETKEKIQADQLEWKELGYKHVKSILIDKTTIFINDILYYLWDFKIKIEIPEILPCPDGSININWEMPTYNLLINFPSDETELIDYYGKNLRDKTRNIFGKCSLEMVKEVVNQWILKTHPDG